MTDLLNRLDEVAAQYALNWAAANQPLGFDFPGPSGAPYSNIAEEAAARIRELEAEVARLRENNRTAFERERDAAVDAWNGAAEEAAEVAMSLPPDGHEAWAHGEQIAAAIRKLKRETKE